MKGRLYGIGAGPGDPELLTLKAVRVMRECEAIAIPKAGSGESTVFTIVEKFIEGKELIECSFAMEKDMAKRKAARQLAAGRMIPFLDAGKDVGFVTLGDPATYSTYMYVHELITGMGYEAEIVPGITSYAAAAAAFGVALCEDREALTVIPARHGENIGELLAYPGNKVIMKSGNNLAQVLDILKERGYGGRTKIACQVSTGRQQLYESIEDYEKAPEAGYLTVAIVKMQGKTQHDKKGDTNV